MEIAVIGGGAAGFFAAISAKENHPDARVVIFEKSNKLLAKVKISGGGRCNVTNACSDVPELIKAYPRGGKQLRKLFHQFHTQHTWDWFTKRGVPLMVQEDNCVFPVSQDSQSVIDCFLRTCKHVGIVIFTKMGVKSLVQKADKIVLSFNGEKHPAQVFDKVIVATGGSPKRSGLEWLEESGHKIVDPVPSLFTFNMPGESIQEFMGIVVEKTQVQIQGTKLKSQGPLLITHWGMSGPAILVLSSFGARVLEDKNYNFHIQVNWVDEKNHNLVLEELQSYVRKHPKKQLSNMRPYGLPQRLWLYLLEKKEISPERRWIELGSKSLNKLITVLTHDSYHVDGKTTFKEEFVTCGGIALESVNMNTMESKAVKNLYFTGEVLDIDAITGGFNFQAAWTTAYIAGRLS